MAANTSRGGDTQQGPDTKDRTWEENVRLEVGVTGAEADEPRMST